MMKELYQKDSISRLPNTSPHFIDHVTEVEQMNKQITVYLLKYNE